MCHHDAGLVVVGDGVLGKLTDLTDTELLIGEEFDPDGAAVGDRIRIGIGSWRRKFLQHRIARSGRELELSSAVERGYS